jgi:GT2 family glycosyltransferase
MSVIVATWNACEVLGDCLESLAGQELDGGFETIVVDNASTDGTADLLRRHADRVHVISNVRNAGFSVANNQAAREARGRVLFFLNSDTKLLATDTLERLARAVQAPDVGIAGPMLVNPDGSLQASCAAHPSVGRALLVSSGLHRLLPDTARARVVPGKWGHDRSIDTGWVMGAAMAVRADVFRTLGGFWLTMYAEDEDLAYRVQQQGLRVRFESTARVMHVGNHSLAKRWSNAERAARVANAELVFLRTHYGRARAGAIRTIVGAGYLVRALAHGLLGRRAPALVHLRMAWVYAGGRRGAET